MKEEREREKKSDDKFLSLLSLYDQPMKSYRAKLARYRAVISRP